MTRARRIGIWIVGTLLLLAGIGYVAIGFVLHGTLADVSNGCRNRTNRPSLFTDHSNHFDPASPDLSSFYMEAYEIVLFESREEGLNLSAWYIQGDADKGAVISVHGIGSCKYSVVNLLQAGM